MPITSAGLKAQIISEMTGRGFNPLHPATNGEAEQYIEAIATAVVSYLTANALIVGTVTSGVAAGDPIQGVIT